MTSGTNLPIPPLTLTVKYWKRTVLFDCIFCRPPSEVHSMAQKEDESLVHKGSCLCKKKKSCVQIIHKPDNLDIDNQEFTVFKSYYMPILMWAVCSTWRLGRAILPGIHVIISKLRIIAVVIDVSFPLPVPRLARLRRASGGSRLLSCLL
jgi:hypothetical protein